MNALEARGVDFEGLLDARVSFTEADAEGEIGVAPDRPGGSRGEQADEDFLGDPPLLLGVRASQFSDELSDGSFKRVLLWVGSWSHGLGLEARMGNEETDGLQTFRKNVIQQACHGTYLLPVNRGHIEFEELPLYSTYHFVQRGVLHIYQKRSKVNSFI